MNKKERKKVAEEYFYKRGIEDILQGACRHCEDNQFCVKDNVLDCPRVTDKAEVNDGDVKE
jgi:hypothetical protein